ncbi:MAG: VWA domain-containing protein [Planctomycetes bacterium]|nr:VWA domain-containing protein [Planctomycetota bacterium]
MFSFDTLFGRSSSNVIQLPGNMVAPEFGEVAVRRSGDKAQVAATIAMGTYLVGDGEQCSVGVALDASKSMLKDYGKAIIISSDHREEFVSKGLYKEVVVDGVEVKVLEDEAKVVAMDNGWIEPSLNSIQGPVRDMLESLIRTFATGGAEGGKCELLYCSCGKSGSDIELAGSFGLADLPALTISGPSKKEFGGGTKLAPAFRHFATKYKASNGVFVFITDGTIEDEKDIINETIQVARQQKAGKRKSLKCIILGVGRKIDRDQLSRLDDMVMPDDVKDIDIWNAVILSEMRDHNDAWSELFDPETVVGTSMKVFDPSGKVVHQKTDEVKAVIAFEMPAGCSHFTLEIDGETRISQKLPPH